MRSKNHEGTGKKTFPVHLTFHGIRTTHQNIDYGQKDVLFLIKKLYNIENIITSYPDLDIVLFVLHKIYLEYSQVSCDLRAVIRRSYSGNHVCHLSIAGHFQYHGEPNAEYVIRDRVIRHWNKIDRILGIKIY